MFFKGVRISKYEGGFDMESKHLIISGIWAVVIIVIIGFFLTGTSLEFLGYLILLFIAFVFSLMTELLLRGKAK